MPVPSNNGHRPETQRPESADRGGIDELLAEAEALRSILSDASARATPLLAALKQQWRQARAIKQAMQSLHQLHLDR